MALVFMTSCYQAEFRFAIEQTSIVREIKRAIFPAEPEADGNLRAVKELSVEAGIARSVSGFIDSPLRIPASTRQRTLPCAAWRF